MGQWFRLAPIVVVFMVMPVSISAQTQGLSIGYGFGALSNDATIGRIEEGSYNFFQLAYQYERALSNFLGLRIEPFLSYTGTPKDGVDAGITLSLKYTFHKKGQNGFFLILGGGPAYTSINFKEQGTHLLFTLQTGIGYKWNNFFIENRFKHYSNAGTVTPNRSINANVIMAGIYF